MSLTHRDSIVVGALVLVLIGIGGMMAVPASAPPAVVSQVSPTASPQPPAVYREGLVGAPQSITPVTARSWSERTMVGLIFSGLVRLGPDNTLQPDLARTWTVDATGRTWTFHIRDDATWQDGVPVTSDDVVFTVEALKSPDAAGAASASWAEVTATAVDPKTVEITLDTPVSGFVAAATQPLLPAHLLADVPFADLASSDFARLPVGTGPFAITEIDDSHAVLEPAVLLDASANGDESPGPQPSIIHSPPRCPRRHPGARSRTSSGSSSSSTPTMPPPQMPCAAVPSTA